MALFKKILKYFLYTLLALFISANLFIVLTGRFYIYKGIRYTYLRGEIGPTIYDLDVFYNAEIPSSPKKEQWPSHPNANKQKIPAQHRKYMEDLDTRAFLVFKRDTLIYEEYWDDHGKTTVSNSFSMAKTVVSMLIGIAIEEGKIGSLDDKVGKYIPEFNSDGKEKITIRDLLEMASGLDWEESGSNPLSDNAKSYYGWDLYGHVTGQKLVSTPGKIFNYQSGNSQLLGFIIKKATGKSVSKYFNEKIWSKIGSENKAYWSLDDEGGDEKAFCCLYSTGRDYGKLGKLLINKGSYNGEQIIPAWYYDEMIKPADLKTSDGTQNQRYGLHTWLYFGNANPAYYFRGLLGQYIITIPAEDLVIIRLGEKKSPNFEISEEMKSDKQFVAKHQMEVGHSTNLFQYIIIGKIIDAQTK